MTCEECRERLQELADEELAAGARKAVEAHLSACPTCTQEYRELAHFTTSVAQAVRPLGPSAELSSKVLTTYRESREQLKAAPKSSPGRGRKPLPSWAWQALMGLLVLAGLVVLAWPSGARDVGHVRADAGEARVLRYTAAGWQAAGRTRLQAGDRVEVAKAGTEATLDFGVWGEARLHGPCGVQVDCAGETLVLQLLAQAPGSIILLSRAAPSAGGKRLRVAWGSAWAEVHAGDRNEATVVPLAGQGGGWTGQLKVTVKTGAARLGNMGPAQTVAEGFSRVVPQSGECEAAAKTE